MMKMILLLTNKADVTVDFIVKELRKRGISFYRLNTEDIPNIVEVNFDICNESFVLYDYKKEMLLNISDFNSVYFRRAEISELNYIDDLYASEIKYLRSELAYLIEGIYKSLRNKFWLNNVYQIREAENKIYQLQLAMEVGFNIPNSIISNNIESVEKFILDHEDNCIIKPIKSGHMKDFDNPKVIFTSQIKINEIGEKDRVRDFPMYVQMNIPKKYDLRCIVVGDNVFCAEIESQNNQESTIDWRKAKTYLNHNIHNLPAEVKDKCIEITKRLSLNYAAIDLIYDINNNYIFLECNPNGQWAWLEKRLGFNISECIVDLLIKRGDKSENS